MRNFGIWKFAFILTKKIKFFPSLLPVTGNSDSKNDFRNIDLWILVHISGNLYHL